MHALKPWHCALQVEWDKGCALDHLLGALGLAEGNDVLPIYIGDDRTDEDAFRLLAKRPAGFGILVSTRVRRRLTYMTDTVVYFDVVTY